MKREEIYLALDIGSGYLKAAHFSVDKNENKLKNLSFQKERLEKSGSIFLEDLKLNTSHLIKGDEKGIIFGLSSDFLKGKTASFTYQREDFHRPIDEEEIQKIIQTIESKILEKLKQQFWQENQLDAEFKVADAKIENIFVDGYRTLDLLGFQGKEITLGIFNTIASQSLTDALENLCSFLNLPLVSINHLAYVTTHSFIKKNNSLSAIFIDIGANNTDIIFVKNGLIKEIRNLPVGGMIFSQSLMDQLKVGLGEAESIKIQYSSGELAILTAQKISQFFEYNLSILKRNIKLVVDEFSQLDVLPKLFYIYGGGSLLPDVKKTIENIFSTQGGCEIIFLNSADLVNVSSLAESSFETFKDNIFSKILKRCQHLF